MPHIFWYYCVILIGLGMLIFTMYKKRNFIDLLSFFLAATSAGYLCEVIVLFVFNSYSYKPGVFKDPIAEDILGHLTCNGFFWGGFAIFVAVFALNYLWIILISCFFMLTEILFLKVGAYEHHWWKLYMTGVGAFVFFTLIKKWYSGLQKKRSKVLRSFTFIMISWVILQGTSVLLSLFELQHYRLGWVTNIFRDDILISVPYQVFLAIIYGIFVVVLKKWYWKTVPFVINILMDGSLMYINILLFKGSWNLFYLILLRYIGFIIFILLEKYTLKIKYE